MHHLKEKWAIPILMGLLCLAVNANTDDCVRVLSIDGGGVRGVIPAVILEKIEEEVGKPAVEIFDMVVGSSTGGILALGLAAPNQQGRPVVSAKGAVNQYINQCHNIFCSSLLHWVKNIGGLIGPRYDSSGIERMLREQLGDTKLSEALIPTIITGYHIAGHSGIEFSSVEAKTYPADKDCLMRQIGMATAAAPVYFDAVDIDFNWGTMRAVTDGSLYAHNPSLIAYVNAKRLFPNKRIEIYSLGTGVITPEDLSSQLKGRGLVHWLAPIIDHIQIGGTDADNAILHRLLNEDGEENFFRLNVQVDKAHNSIDGTTPENLLYLYQQGLKVTKSSAFSEVVKRLKSAT